MSGERYNDSDSSEGRGATDAPRGRGGERRLSRESGWEGRAGDGRGGGEGGGGSQVYQPATATADAARSATISLALPVRPFNVVFVVLTGFDVSPCATDVFRCVGETT